MLGTIVNTCFPNKIYLYVQLYYYINMRIVFLVTTFFLFSIISHAQDIIVKKDGTVIQAKVSEIGTSEVKYKKWSNQDGPVYAIAKGEILAITYQNGEKEMFNDTPVTAKQSESQHGPQLIERPTASNNANLIEKYNKVLKFKEQEKIGKEVKSAVGLFAFGENSVLSNDEVEIQFVVSKCNSPATSSLGDPIFRQNAYLLFRYSVVVKNKTNNTIFFDLANCTRSNNKTMDSRSYYTGESVSVSHGNSTGIGVGGGTLIGSIGVGLGLNTSSSNSATRTYTQDRIISIPPQSFKTIADFKLAKVKSEKCEMVSRGEELIFGFSGIISCNWWGGYMFQKAGIPYGSVKKNEIVEYTHDNSPLVLDYRFVYSNSSDFSQYSVVNANLYLKELIGLPCQSLQGYFKEWTKNWGRNSKAIDDYLDGYDDSTICGVVILEK